MRVPYMSAPRPRERKASLLADGFSISRGGWADCPGHPKYNPEPRAGTADASLPRAPRREGLRAARQR